MQVTKFKTISNKVNNTKYQWWTMKHECFRIQVRVWDSIDQQSIKSWSRKHKQERLTEKFSIDQTCNKGQSKMPKLENNAENKLIQETKHINSVCKPEQETLLG